MAGLYAHLTAFVWFGVFLQDDYFRTWSPSKSLDQETDVRLGNREQLGSKTRAVSGKWRVESVLMSHEQTVL
ncbi:testican-1 isoform X2 [Arapaima gigas]